MKRRWVIVGAGILIAAAVGFQRIARSMALPQALPDC
jgi:hypothetical protein